MKCPHCLVSFYENWHPWDKSEWRKIQDEDGRWLVKFTKCPSCNRITIALVELSASGDQEIGVSFVRPKSTSRTPLSTEVPSPLASDYREACLVLADSQKASAALSRRCLQNLLREKAGVKHGGLSGEIQQVIDSGKLPSHLADAIDAVRHIGNFAAHPMKSKSTGEIVEVEPGEAEWLLDTLEGLFDFYFVQPAQLKAKRDALNEKLKDIGKPPLKGTPPG